jgi:hypothetical protein
MNICLCLQLFIIFLPKSLSLITQEVNFGILDGTNTGRLTVLPAIKMVLNKMANPAINALGNWGALAETPHGKKTKQNFLDSFDSFLQYMDGKSFLFN